VRADIGQPGLDFGDAMRILGGFGFSQQRVALAIGLQHDCKKAFRSVWSFLRQPSNTPAWRDLNMALLSFGIASDDSKQGGLAGTVAADQSNPRAGWNTGGGSFQQLSPGNTNSKIVDDEHGAPFGRLRAAKQPFDRL
jgi:hypothetical protein